MNLIWLLDVNEFGLLDLSSVVWYSSWSYFVGYLCKDDL
jgi:hypothetical protein